ncbi:hypothetical protein [Nocardioides sp. CFH 31398]|uniref:TolB family protein n=1 Tax=Nocardioides sp. CFH 31398 TaxID=2919579 RepID=UPI001F05A8C8|nr:hypothetical protein [Nocardioides sp. CFH 31398]MCH1865628.1 hypothetical protein [Nocardioides sp. CFH 31398]
MSRVRLALVSPLLAVLTVSPTTPATGAAAADPTDGPLLYSVFGGVELAPLGGSPVTRVVTGLTPWVSEFSPDGGRVASLVVRCRVGESPCPDGQDYTTVVETAADGGSLEAAELPGRGTALSWNSAATEVAVLVERSLEDRSIWRVPLDGRPPVRLVQDTPTFEIDWSSDSVSWRPGGDQVAFVAASRTGPEDGWFSVDHQQLWTVSADGGSPVRYSARVDDRSDPRYAEFSSPEWSPDGTTLVAYVFTDDVDRGCRGAATCSTTVSVVRRGEKYGTPATTIPIAFTDGGYSQRSAARPVWSADGSRILFGVSDEEFVTQPRVVTVATGALQKGAAPHSYQQFDDWQPCPTGTCVQWGAPPQYSLAVGYRNRPRIAVDLTVTPAAVKKVAVTLHRQDSRGAWVQVKRVLARTTAGGTWSGTLPRVRPGICRLRFGGVGATQTKLFSC